MQSWINSLKNNATKLVNKHITQQARSSLLIAGLVIAVLIGFYYALRQAPILVDVQQITNGPMIVTIKEEGETRVKDIYVVSSPISGHLDRTTLDEGAKVISNKTVIASIHPLDPPFIDERQFLELSSAAAAARSAVALAKTEYEQAKSNLQLANSEYKRYLTLSKKKVISDSQLEKIANEAKVRKAQLQSALANISLRKSQLKSAESRLKQPTDVNPQHKGKNCCIELRSPIDGVVLDMHAKSQQTVSMGAKIASIGNPSNLEIVVDLLSSDAPKIKPNSKVIISDWGGNEDLKAVVRLIEPAAYTKVSALGIEEQRVNALIDLKSVPKTLGHGYRVLADIIIWSNETVTQIPIGALFRSNGKWAAFFLNDGKAELKHLEIGHMNDKMAEVISGTKQGETVILYPNDQINNGHRVEERE